MKSLQTRVAAMVLASVAALWLIAAAVVWIDARHELDELLDSHLAQAATLLIAQASDAELEHQFTEAARQTRFDRRVAFQMWHEGRLQWRSANAPTAPMLTRERGFETTRINGEPWRVFATRGKDADIQLYVGEQIEARDDILGALLRGLLAPFAIGLPLLALVVWLAVFRSMRPLRRLAGQLDQRAPEDLHAIDVLDMPREVEQLANALNALFLRIAQLVGNERRFTQDAAHELRTPIAAIRSQAQVAAAATDNDTLRDALAKTLQGCDRASRLIDQLLQLARLDGGTAAAAQQRSFDLARTAEALCAAAYEPASAKGITLALDAPCACPLNGDESLTTVMLRNLIDNAVRYAPIDGQVRVQIVRDTNATVLTIEDSGGGLSAAQSERLGERFFRVRDNDADGSGLGWSIVRRIAETTGANVAVDRSPALGGMRVTIRWAAT